MSEGNEAKEQSGDNQQAPETKATKEDEQKIHSFDETASVVDDDGEINKVINHLFDLCKAKNIPLVLALAHKIEDGEDSFEAEIRGTVSTGKDGFLPPNLAAMNLVLKHRELSKMVTSFAHNKSGMEMLALLSKLSE